MSAVCRACLLGFLVGALQASCEELCRNEEGPATLVEEEELSTLQLSSSAQGAGAVDLENSKPTSKEWADFAKWWAKPQQSEAEKQKQIELGLNDTPPLPVDPEEDALGLLTLTYGYPTQPGDIDDKRTWCDVDKNGKCTKGFSIIKAEVHGLTFEAAQNATWDSKMERSFTTALKALLNHKHPTVRAITGNCGFITNYETHVSKIMKKLVKQGFKSVPMLLGSLSLGPIVTPQKSSKDNDLTVDGWDILKENERVVVVTANSATLSEHLFSIMHQEGMEDMNIKEFLRQSGKTFSNEQVKKLRKKLVDNFGLDPDDKAGQRDALMSHLITASELHGAPGAAEFLKNADQYFRIYGAQSVEGFGQPVADGTAHDVSVASLHMNAFIVNTLFRIEYFRKDWREVKGRGIILECTELPAYANGLRMATRLPVWDITTMATCMMAASPSYKPSEPIRQNSAFKDCMLSWLNPYKFEPRFGEQPDGSIVGYEPAKIPAKDLKDFDWGLLGKPEGQRCTDEIGCVA